MYIQNVSKFVEVCRTSLNRYILIIKSYILHKFDFNIDNNT